MTHEQDVKIVTRRKIKKGLVIVYTGNGKGKTTAAMGMLMRAWGRQKKLIAVQFIKNSAFRYGEITAAQHLGIEVIQVGDGCTWTSKDMQKTIACGQNGWELAKEKILDTSYDIVLLDEFTHLLHFEWLDVRDVVGWLKGHKPPDLHLVITGRHAPDELLHYADLVTEMVEIKHPFRQEGLLSQEGIDF